MTNDEKFDLILSSIGKLTNKFDSLENKFDGLENRFDSLENRFDNLENRFNNLENRFDNLENRFDNLENKVDKIENKVDRIEKEQTRINMVIENDIKKNIDIIIENYEPAAKAMVEKVADIDSLKTNVQLLNRIVAEHSDRIDKISKPA